MNTAAKLLLVAAAPLGAAAGSCDTFYGKAATYHVIDSGLGQPVDEYMNKWTPATWLRNGSYVATLMNGTVAQTGPGRRARAPGKTQTMARVRQSAQPRGREFPPA